MCIDIQVVNQPPNQYYYWAERALSLELVRLQNEAIAQLCSEPSERIVGLGTFPLQYPDLACEQLKHALDLKGVEISTAVGGRELSSPEILPFWDAAEVLDAVVLIHPFGTTLGQRTSSRYILNAIGQPLDTTIALLHLIFGDGLDTYPGRTIVAAHRGGYLPTCSGHSDLAFAVRPAAATASRTKRSDLLNRIWIDSVVYDGLARSSRHSCTSLPASWGPSSTWRA